MAAGHSEAPCLGCGRVFKVPTAIYKMAEHYDDGRIVLFCKRACNVKFIATLGQEGQEEQMKSLIERLENPT